MTRAVVALGVFALAALVLPMNAFALSAGGPDEAAPETLPSTPAVQPPTTLPIVPDGLSLRPHADTVTQPHEATVQEHLPAVSPDTGDLIVADPALDAARVATPGALGVGVAGGDVSSLDASPATPGHEGRTATPNPMPVIPHPEPDPVIVPVPRFDQA